jgi:hypothetical protein
MGGEGDSAPGDITALALLSAWSDDELADGDVEWFCGLLYDRAWTCATDIYDPDAYDLVPLEPDEAAAALTFYLRRRAWAEWYFGTVTPSRQIALLPEDAVSMRMRLARQIQDELRHHDLFANAARSRRGEWRVDRFPSPPALARMHETQRQASSAAELAAANQFGGEIVLLMQAEPERNALQHLLDGRTQDIIVDIESDEPAHVELGHDLVSAFAIEPAQRRTIAACQERFLTALSAQHASELESLGSRRTRGLPTFDPTHPTAVGDHG